MLQKLSSDGCALYFSKQKARGIAIPPRFQVVIFSNQKKISIQKDIKGGRSDSKSLAMFKNKLVQVMTQLDIPLSVYAATTDAEYRKPRLGMWREFQDDYDLDVVGVDLAASFFVGDAGGRPGDHSAADRWDIPLSRSSRLVKS